MMQDLTAALKWNAIRTPLTGAGTLQAFLVASGGVPLTGYTPGFLPMSIGIGSRTASGRLTLNFQTKSGLFVEGTGAYTFRDEVTMNRSAYFTDDRLFLTDTVAMPDVVDYTFRAGYWRHGLYVPISFSQRITLQVAPTVQHAHVLSALGRLSASGPTALRDALFAGLQLVPPQKTNAGYIFLKSVNS